MKWIFIHTNIMSDRYVQKCRIQWCGVLCAYAILCKLIEQYADIVFGRSLQEKIDLSTV